jgi:hypothetical protein
VVSIPTPDKIFIKPLNFVSFYFDDYDVRHQTVQDYEYICTARGKGMGKMYEEMMNTNKIKGKLQQENMQKRV